MHHLQWHVYTTNDGFESKHGLFNVDDHTADQLDLVSLRIRHICLWVPERSLNVRQNCRNNSVMVERHKMWPEKYGVNRGSLYGPRLITTEV